MPEYLRALIVILVLATVVFYFAKAPATAVAIAPDDFVRRRNTWFFITLAGFLSQNYWVFAVIVSLVIYNAAKKEPNKIALFFFVVLALPQIAVDIPGFAGIKYFFTIDYVRILSLVLLLPVCLNARKFAIANRSSANFADKVLITYVVLNLALQLQHDVATNVVRSALGWCIDVLIPYYAISRSVRDAKSFRDVLMSFVIAAMLASLVGIFEFLRHWILYSSAGSALGVVWEPGYLSRGDFLRASATSGQSIILGYVIAIAIGFFWTLRRFVSKKHVYVCGLLLLIAGIISPLSRGPWVGLIVMLLVFLMLGEKPFRSMSKLALLAFPLGIALMFTDAGQKVIDYLPFVGTVDEKNVTYRQLLFETSYQIILDNPLFGSTDYLLHMEELRQGQGIIDLVNTYLIVGLNTGLVGLGLYVLFFGLAMLAAHRQLLRLPFSDETRVLGQGLLAVLVGALATIATVSPIFHVPLLLWSLSAMCMAFSSLTRSET